MKPLHELLLYSKPLLSGVLTYDPILRLKRGGQRLSHRFEYSKKNIVGCGILQDDAPYPSLGIEQAKDAISTFDPATLIRLPLEARTISGSERNPVSESISREIVLCD